MTPTYGTINGMSEHGQPFELLPLSAEHKRLKEVFRERALRFAQRGHSEKARTTGVRVLVFRLAAERFGFETACVQQVYPRLPITPIPGRRGVLLGVANLSGSIRSVVDPNALLELPERCADARYIIMLRSSGKSIGMLVDDIEGTRRIELDELNNAPQAECNVRAELVKGFTNDHILVLDPKSIFERIADKCRGEGERTETTTVPARAAGSILNRSAKCRAQ
jgi:chemotaxis signal transduction protein